MTKKESHIIAHSVSNSEWTMAPETTWNDCPFIQNDVDGIPQIIVAKVFCTFDAANKIKEILMKER
jgi:hypothetical protein